MAGLVVDNCRGSGSRPGGIDDVEIEFIAACWCRDPWPEDQISMVMATPGIAEPGCLVLKAEGGK